MSRRFFWVAGVLAVLVLIAGIGQLFLMRFRVGDIYPPYSTFRTDPLGARALYDSFAGLPGLTVERNMRPIEHLESGRDTVLLFLGDTVSTRPNHDSLPSSAMGWMNRFLRSGGRIVITLQPRDVIRGGDRDEDDETNRTVEAKAPGKQHRGASTNKVEAALSTNAPARPEPLKLPDEDESRVVVSLTNWMNAAFAEIPVSGVATATVTAAGRDAGLPEELACYSALCFTNAGAPWRVLYTCGGQPVIMERPLGQGTFVLSTLSYFVSNQALRDERQTALLVWLLGGRTHVVFDETHDGIQELPGLMTMVRRYGLTWALVNLLVLAGLFIWRNNASLVPAEDAGDDSGADVAAGKDSATALGNLLRRNVSRGELLATCVVAWKRSADHGTRLPDTTIRRIDARVEAERLLPEGQRSPEKLYNEICRTVKTEPMVKAQSAQGKRRLSNMSVPIRPDR